MHNLSTRLHRHRGQRGQTVPIAALMAVVILGASAIAVDMSLHTHERRSLQNVSDSSALAGAQDLIDPSNNSSGSVQTARQTAVLSALTLLHQQLGFSLSNPNFLQQMVQGGDCSNSSSHCYVDSVGVGAYTISVDTPPKNAGNYGNSAWNGDSHFLEITLYKLSQNYFGRVIGQPSTTEGAHSIAYHFPAGQPFGFALYANSVVSDGNEDEIITGDVYSYRNINPQSNGHASFCAAQNSDGTGGNIVLGYPQYPSTNYPNPDPAGGASEQYLLQNNGADPDVLHQVGSCNGIGSSWVAQTGVDASHGVCPSSVRGVNIGGSSYFDSSYTKACVANPAILEPNLTGPTDNNGTTTSCPADPPSSGTYAPGYYKCTGSTGPTLTTLNVDAPLAQGVYHIAHNDNCKVQNNCYDVQITNHSGHIAATSGNSGCPTTTYDVYLCGVTFILDDNATIGVSGGEVVVITPYVPPAGQSTGNDGTFPVYAKYGTTGQSMTLSNTNTSVTMAGTFYLPGGSMNVGQNAFLFIDGQAIVDTWNVQSGNHANPDIRYDANRAASLKEILRLVQ